MAEKSIKLEVVTPQAVVLSQEVSYINVPASQGYLGILPNHASLVTGLEIGVITFKENNKDKKIAISGGFMEVINNKVVILADAAELGDKIDIVRAEAAKERAEKRLIERQPDLDIERANLALRRALSRISAAR